VTLQDRVAIVTGGANGIGRALCRALSDAGARHVYVGDIDEAAARQVADEINGSALRCDVSREEEIQQLVEDAESRFGRVDLFVSNAGITSKGGPDVPDEEWLRLWNVNLMAHVYAARAVLPGMVQRGEGYLVQVSSAAGILTEIGSAPYSVTKHAAVSFAEWLSIHYQKQGIRVSCVCPAGVATDFLNLEDPVHQFLHFSSVTPEELAQVVLEGIREERFLIVSHEEIHEFFAFKSTDYDRWLKNFAHLHRKIERQTKRAEKKRSEESGE
jgi:NAD(P)-dependent dehydrogenase (short-subunit alcohol dehydrogenase family)